jgi:adenine-specific DNA methylase
MEIKDRIKELRRVRASELVPNAKNWRTHPTAQAQALRAMLLDVGYADALTARELPDQRLGRPHSLHGMIANRTRAGEFVYDPFRGSGSTIIAAHQLGRTGYAVEIDPGYVAVTLERLSMLGLKPELVK